MSPSRMRRVLFSFSISISPINKYNQIHKKKLRIKIHGFSTKVQYKCINRYIIAVRYPAKFMGERKGLWHINNLLIRQRDN